MMRFVVAIIVCFASFVAVPAYASDGSHDNNIAEVVRPTVPPSFRPARRKLQIQRFTNSPTKSLNYVLLPQTITTSAPIPFDGNVFLKTPSVSTALVVTKDPWMLTNPSVIKSGATCGVVGKPECHIKARAAEMGDPKKGIDCSNYGRLAFHDPNGYCYVCPLGFDRTWDPVTSDTACANNNINWVTDREPVGLFNMAMMDEVVQKLNADEVKAIYNAALLVQPGANGMMIYNFTTNPQQSLLLCEAVKYHLVAYAANGQINESDPEYTTLRWMAEYIRYYRIYLANEASKMLNAWLGYQAFLGRNVALAPLNIAPPFKGMVTSAYLFGNGGNSAVAATASTLILSTLAYLLVAVPAFGIKTFFASGFVTYAFVGTTLTQVPVSIFTIALAVVGPVMIVIIGILIAIQGFATVFYNHEVENAVRQEVIDANKPYDVNMLISSIQANSMPAITEFATCFSAAAAGESKPTSEKTNLHISSYLADSLCDLLGRFYYEDRWNCPRAPITQNNIATAVKTWVADRKLAINRFGPIYQWNTSQVTDMSYLFLDASSFNDDISSWDTSRVVKMNGMFYGAKAFNKDISRWNTASVKDMSYMFYGASAFSQSIGGWTTSKVTNMTAMFANTRFFKSNISGWDTSNVVDMHQMFDSSLFSGDVSRWNTAKVTNMAGMFNYALKFNGDLSNWNTAMVTDMSYMFCYTYAFNADITRWNTANVRDMQHMFDAATSFNRSLCWDLSSVGDRQAHMFDSSYGCLQPYCSDSTNLNILWIRQPLFCKRPLPPTPTSLPTQRPTVMPVSPSMKRRNAISVPFPIEQPIVMPTFPPMQHSTSMPVSFPTEWPISMPTSSPTFDLIPSTLKATDTAVMDTTPAIPVIDPATVAAPIKPTDASVTEGVTLAPV